MTKTSTTLEKKSETRFNRCSTLLRASIERLEYVPEGRGFDSNRWWSSNERC